MKKLIVALIFICLLSLASLSVVPTSADEEEILKTKILWSRRGLPAPINGTAFTSQTIPDVNDDGHEDVLAAFKVYNDTVVVGGYLVLIDGKDGSTIREISLDYEPTEILYVEESDCIAVAKQTGGVDVFDMEFNLKFSIPTYHTWAAMYLQFGYWVGLWIKKQADYGKYWPNYWGNTSQEGCIGEAYKINETATFDIRYFMEGASQLPAPFTWNPYPYMLDVKMNRTPVPFEYEPKRLNTFDGTDLVYLDGYYVDVGNNTHIVSHSLVNGSLNWRTGGLSAPLTRVDTVEGLEFLPGGGDPKTPMSGTWIIAPIFAVIHLKTMSPTRAVGIMRDIGMPGLNFSRHSSKGEWPLILLDNNGGHVEMYTNVEKHASMDYGWYLTCAENATYEQHVVSPITRYDENRFLVTITGVEASVLVMYTIAYDNFTIVWKKPVDRGDMNRGLLIEDLNDDGEKEIIAVVGGNVTVLDGTDGSERYRTDLSTFVVVDMAHLSLGDVILTNEGNATLLSFGSSNHTTYWTQYLGVAWETYMSPMQDVDGDDLTDLVVASGNNVTCYWGYYEIYTPPPPPIQEQLWFWTVIAVVADVIVIGLVGLARRRALRKEAAATA